MEERKRISSCDVIFLFIVQNTGKGFFPLLISYYMQQKRPIPPSNFMVYPFLFLSNTNLDFILDEKEVKNLITPTIDEILSFEILNGEFGINKTINPYFDFQGKRIWGATAMILKELIDLLVK